MVLHSPLREWPRPGGARPRESPRESQRLEETARFVYGDGRGASFNASKDIPIFPRHDPWDCRICRSVGVVLRINVGIYGIHGVSGFDGVE